MVHECVIGYFSTKPEYYLISHHPCDSKRYSSCNIQIPKRPPRGRTGRDVVDFIYISENELLLIEAKGRLSETEDDQEKLDEISQTYTLDELLTLFKRYGAEIPYSPKILTKGLAVNDLDTRPEKRGFRIFHCDEKTTTEV